MAEALIEWRNSDNGLHPVLLNADGTERSVGWTPQEGSQRAFLECQAFETLFEGNRGPGKSLIDNIPILTNHGWKEVGDVTYNDKLVSIDGTYTKIEGIFPHEDRPLFKFIFSDDTEVIADDEHRWLVRSERNGARDGWKVKTTAELMKLNMNEWAVPLLEKPAPGKKWTGPDPYILGLLLGDGTLTGKYTTLCTADQYIHDYACERGFSGKQYKKGLWMLQTPDESYRNVLGRNSKHVPQALLEADPQTRLRLLQGLMDSDGCCDKDGRCGAKSISEKLADAYVYLARSLGGMASKRLKEWEQRKPIWLIKVMPANKFNPFAMPRKAERVRKTRRITHRIIRSIIPAGHGPATCFVVKHPSKLFVVDGFVLTHNTDALLMDFAQHVGKGYKAEWRGLLLRQTFPQLRDVMTKAQKWFPMLFGVDRVRYNDTNHTWTWSSGESLRFAYGAKESDYWNYHGFNWPWLGFEELTTWHDPGFYKKMFSCCRSDCPNIPKKIRSTTNPNGCVPFGEVLTNRGWIRIQDVKTGDVVLSTRPDGSLCEVRVSATIKKHYCGNMINSHGMVFTEDHRLPLLADNGKIHELKYFYELHGKVEIRSSATTSVVLNTENITKQPFSGEVYCLTVPGTETFFIRQNGCVWLSGNSGHNWVKARFHLPVAPGQIYGKLIEEPGVPERIAVHGCLDENRILLTADPGYKDRIRAAAKNPSELAAWLYGSWDIVAGGMFDDIWDPTRHVVPNFHPPSSWRVDRSFDWGSTKPFSVGWWAESDGTDLRLPNGRVCSTVRGDLFRIAEWYGWNGQPNEGLKMLDIDIAKGIIEREIKLEIHNRCKAGPADAGIFKTENGVCIAKQLMQPVLINGEYRRLSFVSSNSAPGTRKVGWDLMRQRLLSAAPRVGRREFPGLFICKGCDQTLRTLPVAPRDEDNLDDVDSDCEDHAIDEIRYRVMFSSWRVRSGTTTGT
jgi:intein/homing endonuclease